MSTINREKRQRSGFTRNAGVVGGLTLLSRVFGFLRDAAMAWFFGAGFVSDAFFVAYRIPNFIRKLFAEGALNLAFVPIFIEHMARGGRSDAFDLARSALRSLLLVLSAAALIGILVAPMLVALFAPGFLDSPEKLDLAVSLTRLLFPFIVFIGLSSVCMGVLNAFGHFFAPSLAPLVINLSMIGAMYWISPHMNEPVDGLALGVIAGGVLQLAIQGPYLVKYGFKFWQKATLFHPGLKNVAMLTIPAALGASVFQINVLLDTFIASFLEDGSISYLYFADRMVQFPLGIFAMAAAIVLLPNLSRSAAGKKYETLAKTLVSSVRVILFFTIPAMAGLVVLREPIVSLLFTRGAFDPASAKSTAGALLYYGMGLWAFATVRIVVSTFYALRDARTPLRLALFSILVKAILSLVLIKFLDYKGLALATSIASVLNLIVLARALQIKLNGAISWKEVVISSMHALAASAVMGISLLSLRAFLIPGPGEAFLARAVGLAGCIVIGIIIYFSSSLLFKCGEIQIVFEALKKSRRGRRDA